MSNDGSVNFGDASNSGSASTPLTLSATALQNPAAGVGPYASMAFLPLDASGSLEGPQPLSPLTLGGVMLSGSVATGAAVLTGLDAAGTALTGEAGDGNLQFLGLQASGSTGIQGAAVLSAPTLSASGVNGAVGSASLLLQAPDVSGILLSQGLGDGDMQLLPMSMSGSASSSVVAQADIQLSPAALSGVMVSGNIGVAAITLPLLDASGAQYTNVVGTASIEIPVLALSGVMVQTLAAPTITGFALNSRTRAVSEYSGIAANSMASFGGVTLVATDAGIFALAGDNDNGAPIDAHITTGVTDFGSPMMKRVIAAYVGYRASGDMQVTVIADGSTEYQYALSPRQVMEQHTAKVKFGRGFEARYYQLTLENQNGADFALDSVMLDPYQTGRYDTGHR